MLKVHHARLLSTCPELLPRWKAIYIDRNLHFEAYAHLVENTIKKESIDYAVVL
jgi:hypothetical protein